MTPKDQIAYSRVEYLTAGGDLPWIRCSSQARTDIARPGGETAEVSSGRMPRPGGEKSTLGKRPSVPGSIVAAESSEFSCDLVADLHEILAHLTEGDLGTVAFRIRFKAALS